MEFSQLGSHCGVGHCHRLDFLPFTCKNCRLVLCIDHKEEMAHQCSNPSKDGHTISCPSCQQLLAVNANADDDFIVARHIQNGCKPPKSTLKSGCCVTRCRAKTIALIHCNCCQNQFCLRHRLAEDHNCKPKPCRQSAARTNVLDRIFGNKTLIG
uniref:AN1-type domain-containing protein n=1 Tax=Spongospora subterranea TaxID=70186 RepID=A0A0H5RBV7_9EUKA|eukprot:CRZ11513.1 hypothetical protein [Spongospora subterranea]